MKPAQNQRFGPEPAPTIIETRRGRVECAESGVGPAVLLLHGAIGGHDQGMLLGRAAVGWAGFRFISISRPGYLGTPLALGQTPQEQADLCADVLDALGVKQAAVIAVSAGGQTALQFALRYPKRCWGLIMVSACSAQLSVRLPIMFHLMKVMAHMPGLLALTRRESAHQARSLSDPIAGRLLQALNLSTMDRMAQRLPGTENDITQSRQYFAYPLDRIAAPVLIVHGTADEAVPYEQASSLASKVPKSELLTIQGGEHLALFTNRRQIQQRVMHFLLANTPGG